MCNLIDDTLTDHKACNFLCEYIYVAFVRTQEKYRCYHSSISVLNWTFHFSTHR